MDSDTTHEMVARLERVVAACIEWTGENPERCMALRVSKGEQVVLEQSFGQMRSLAEPQVSVPAQANTIFLAASLTKPLTAIAVCMLIERGQIGLDEEVAAYIPEFGGADRRGVVVRHLLTHTSGLPNMLADDVALRQAKAPLSAFMEKTCAAPLLFAPGSDCRYQSMGTLLAGTIVERVAGVALRQFMEREIFAPLGMKDTFLGMGSLDPRRIASLLIMPDDDPASHIWNGAYWRDLGAPWGGVHTTTGDYMRVLRMMLNGGAYHGRRLMSEAMAEAMLSDQIAAMASLPEDVKQQQAWGLGWWLNRPQGSGAMPAAASPRTFGHEGATGASAWCDPDSGLMCVLLTNDPHSFEWRARLSKMVAESTP